MVSSSPLPSRRQARSREARIIVRPLNSADFFGWHDTFEAHLAEAGQRLPETQALRVWQWLEAKRLEGLVAQLRERIVGLVHFQESLVPSTGTVEIQLQDLYVAPDVRVRGVSDDLILGVHAEAKRRGVDRICTLTPGDDEASLRYWDRLGDRTGVVAYDLPVRARA